MEQLRGRQFDGVLISGVLHLLPDPNKALRYADSLLAENGVLVATVPTFHRLPFLWLWLRHPWRYTGWRDFRRSGVHPISRRQVRTLFRKAGLSLEQVSSTIPQRWKTLVASWRRLAEAFFSSEYTFVGRRTERRGKASAPSAPARQSKIEPAIPLQIGGQADESIRRHTGF